MLKKDKKILIDEILDKETEEFLKF